MQATWYLSEFSPARLVERYEQNRLVRGLERRILDRRRRLMNAYYLAWQQGDRDALRKTMDAMLGFNRAYPEVAIHYRTIRQSFQNRARYREEALDGYAPNQSLREYLMEQRYTGVG